MQYKRIADIADLLNGYAFKSKKYVKSGVRVIRIANVQDGVIVDEKPCFYPEDSGEDIEKYYLKKGDLLISLTGNVGRVGLLPESMLPAVLNQRVSCVRLKDKSVEINYLFWYLRRNGFIRDCIKASKGVAQLNLSTKWIENYIIPVPDIEEQRKIVASIEEKFSELDAGIDILKRVKEQLAVYQQSVLKDAYEGNYTKDYRDKLVGSVENDLKSIKKHGQSYKDIAGDDNELKLNIPSSWRKIRIGDVFNVEVGATPRRNKPEYWNGDICWVSSGEVKFCNINNTQEHITQSGVYNSSTNVQPVGTVLLAMIGEGKTRGQAAILNIPAAHNQNTAAILVSETPCIPKYMYYFLLLNYENTRRVGSGNNQKALNKDRVRALHFPFASFAEQRIIVEEIESRLSICSSIERTVDETIEKAEAIRKSILEKAFRVDSYT